MKKALSFTIILSLLLAICSFSSYCTEISSNEELPLIDQSVSEQQASCIHVYEYSVSQNDNSKHLKVCTKCNYGEIEEHERWTCAASSCAHNCGGYLPAAHEYQDEWTYVGDYDTYNIHAKICISQYGYCGEYEEWEYCLATGEVWTSTWVEDGVHIIYRDCGGCLIGLPESETPHYSDSCIPGCRGN